MVFVCHDKQFLGGVLGVDPREANDMCIRIAVPFNFMTFCLNQ